MIPMIDYERVEADNIKAIEARHVIYLPPPKYAPSDAPDYHLVKEIIHTKDGRKVPNIRLIPNYKREFFITKPGFRKHTQKKDYEQLSRLAKHTSRECDLLQNVARALGQPGTNLHRRAMFRNPYIYGADASSTSIVMHEYLKRWEGAASLYNVAVLDTETDMVHGHEEILMNTISYKDRIVTSIVKSYLKGISDPIPKLRALFDEHLGEFARSRNIKWEIKLVDTPADTVVDVMSAAHAWQPDWVAIWNIDFDITKMTEACQKYGLNPEAVFSDPRVPKPYRNFYYRKGRSSRVTNAGLEISIKPSAQWHTVDTPASFRFVDAMQAYRHVRVGSAELQSYGLDFVMDREIKMRKLRFEEGSHLREGSPDWHIYMQKEARLEYVIYNVFDCIGCELLDEKTMDLASALPTFAKASDLSYYDSQPSRLANEYHFFLKEQHDPPYVLGTASDRLRDEVDEQLYPPKDWIVTLRATNIADNGLKIIYENPWMSTNVFIATADSDIKSSYPFGTIIMNQSKSTTMAEIINIRILRDTGNPYTGRIQGMNLLGGSSNAYEFTTEMFDTPKIRDWAAIYDRKTA